MDMSLIPKWVALDFAIFPIGDVVTMGVDDAIEAAKIVKVNKVLGVHYNTFGFIKLDKANAIQKFGESGIVLCLPEIGESFDIVKRDY